MARVITAPEKYIPGNRPEWTVFLAGAIDMGAAVDWQAEVIERLVNYSHVVLFNPRRAAFTPDTLDEQIWWELEYLERAKTVFMWLPADAKAPISLLEAGFYWKSGKLLIGADMAFYRRRNLEIMGKRYGVYLYHSLDGALDSLVKSVGLP